MLNVVQFLGIKCVKVMLLFLKGNKKFENNFFVTNRKKIQLKKIIQPQ